LTTVNKLADEINSRKLLELDCAPYIFTGKIEGKFSKEYLPTAIDLQVKEGAQIMMLNNDADGRWVNGTIGKIVSISKGYNDKYAIIAELADDDVVEVTPYTWEIYRFFAEGEQLQSEVVGRFKQYPLMLAWAVTIHKSQGKTFEKVIIDIGKGTFTSGQAYVALSRCTTLEGIFLKKHIQKKHIWTDYNVIRFLTRYQYRKAEQVLPVEDKVDLINGAIEKGLSLRIVYLKPNDEKTTRIVRPQTVGEMEYHGKRYLGMQAYCMERKSERIFRIDRILEIQET
jgi:hypothetical protein